MARIKVSPLLVAALCTLYYIDPGRQLLFLLVAAGLHECGHYLMMLVLGHRATSIHLGFTGAVLRTDLLPYVHEWKIALAGPLVNLVLAGLFSRHAPVFAVVNLGLAAFNLLPIYPLDGGRILQALLLSRVSERVAYICMRVCNGVTCALLVSGAIVLTAVYHTGILPALLAGMIILRLGGAVMSGNDPSAVRKKSSAGLDKRHDFL